MAGSLASAPVLSTPDDHILEVPAESIARSTLSADALKTTYEIERTASELRAGNWLRIALQFPDHMLVDAPRVVELLSDTFTKGDEAETTTGEDGVRSRKVHILADTSYSACCVDEIAAEHVDADVVVHYGRTCLSPTSRLPALYVYTRHHLDHALAAEEFRKEFPEKSARVIVMADLTHHDHVDTLVEILRTQGYASVRGTEVLRDPEALIPNRSISGPKTDDDDLRKYAIFHIHDPPSSLLLALQTRFASLHVLSSTTSSKLTIENSTMRTAGLLRRRFARVLSLASAGVIGILVNTLSVSNYLSSLDLLREKIAQAGKKSYIIVVGKLNPAKLANFAEIEGWVVVGCWESGLIEDDANYWRPVVTPFELEVALMSEEERVWGGEWWGGIEKLKLNPGTAGTSVEGPADPLNEGATATDDEFSDVEGGVEGEESMPPVFDLRTGQLVSHSRPMRLVSGRTKRGETAGGGASRTTDDALVKRTIAGEVASINGVASPGAEYLRSQRTWQGLGTDYTSETSTVVEEGRSGIARGYQVGEEGERH